MSLRAYLTLMVFGTVIAVATFFLVLYRVDPVTAGVPGFGFFYLSLFFAICGLVSIFGFLARVVLHHEELLSRMVWLSFRQAVFLATLALVALALHAHGLLFWWNSLLLVAVGTVAEFIFITIERRPVSAKG